MLTTEKKITVKSSYLGDLRTEAEHLQSSVKIITDAPTDNNGKGEAFSPTDLVATALGACMMTLMGIYARRENIDLKGTEYEIIKIMASSPRRISEIHITFDFLATLQIDEEQKEKLKHFAITCPVAQSISPEIKQEIVFNFK